MATHALEGAGSLAPDGAKCPHLAEPGRKIAESANEKRLFFTKALLFLGVEPDTAEEDACRIENVEGDRILSVMKAI